MTERDIFIAALQKEDPTERRAYLDKACAGQPELRQAVEELLRLNLEARTFLQQPAVDPAAIGAFQESTQSTNSQERQGAAIGPYKLIEQIGEGGMGAVWMAQQSEPVKRLVALKLIKAGMDSKQVVARFEAERQALALMDHPNIARVLDVGATSAGRPYFVMDLVRGVPITRYCDEHRLTPRQRLELFIPVCQAVQHAHQKGVIHRDLKPNNVLVALYDGRPVPKVIDFGVAKATGQSLTDKTLVTGFGAIVGTLEYMSPEQAEINELDIDTRSDIYSLGVLLYELLAGSPPFSRQVMEKAGMLEMLRVIREQEPSKPSTKLSTADGLPTLAANRGTEPAKLAKLVRGELDWIVLKALEKDRGRRYATANGFAMDVQRYLTDEPVEACPPSAAYRLRKFARRNRAAVLAAAAILFVLLAGIAGTTFGLIHAEQRRAEADKARADEAEQRRIADAQTKKAEQAEADTLADYRASTDDAVEQLIGSKPSLGPQERAYLEKTLKRWQAFAARQGDDERSRAIRAEGHHRVGYLWQQLGRQDEAREAYMTARDLQQKLATDFPAEPRYRQGLAATRNNLGLLLVALSRHDAAREEHLAAREMQTKLVAAFPDEPAYQQGLAATHDNLGLLEADLRRHEAACGEFEAARTMQKKLVAAFPTVPQYQTELARTHGSLANSLAGLSQRDAARAEYETARDLQRKLVAGFPTVPQYQSDLALTHNSLGMMLNELGQRDAARGEYEAARDLQKKLVAAFPAVPEHQRNLAATHYSLGILWLESGRSDTARAEYEASRDLRTKLTETYPAISDYQWELAMTHNGLAILLAGLSQYDASRREFETACSLHRKLVAAHPAVPQYQQELAASHNNLGKLLLILGKPDAARAELETARELQKKLVAAFPAVPQYRIELGASYNNFGTLVREGGRPAESMPWYDLSISTLTPIFDQDRRQVTVRQYLRNGHYNRAVAYDLLKKHPEALKDWDKAVELSPEAEKAEYRAGRATSRLQAGETAAAVAEVAALTQSSKWSAEEWYGFACVFAAASARIADQKQTYADRSMDLLRQAVKAGYGNAAHLAKDADMAPLRQREDFKKLVADVEAKAKKSGGRAPAPDKKPN